MTAVDVRTRVRHQAARGVLGALARSLVTAVVTFAIVIAVWFAVAHLFGVSPYVVRDPLQVFDYLFLHEEAAAHRSSVAELLGVTTMHALLGFLVGMAIAIVAAVLFRLFPPVETALMPLALLLRSVPLVALAPVIFIVVGIATQSSVIVIGAIVVLFPALVTIALGLKTASQQMLDVVHTFGGNAFMAIWKVALPGAIPSVFAAIRVSVPGAFTGALLAEQLSTGDGMGSAATTFLSGARFDDLWANVVTVTFVSILAYMVAQLIESIVLARMGMTDRS